MRHAVAFFVLWAAVYLPESHGAEMRLQPLAANVYAAVQPTEQRFDDSNSMLIVTTEGVVIVDAQAQRANALRVMELASQVSDLPVVMVINTHWHPDHTQGNALYRQRYGDGLTIIGHDLLFEQVPGLAAPDLARRVESVAAQLTRQRADLDGGVHPDGSPLSAPQRAALQVDIERARGWLDENRQVRFLTPTLSYDDFMRLQIGDMRIHLIHFRAHTGGDTVVWLPEHKIMASGDVLDAVPYVADGYPSSWVNALYDIDMMNARLIVPGHGPVLRSEEQIEIVRGFLEALCRDVAAARARGMTIAEAKQTLRFSGDRSRLAAGEPRAARLFDAVLGDAIESAWREADGLGQR